MNQPWGFAAAPNNFGPLSNTFLISNNTNSGTINAFNLLTRQFVGTVKDTSGDVIHIDHNDQLWAIDFGGGGSTPSGFYQHFVFYGWTGQQFGREIRKDRI